MMRHVLSNDTVHFDNNVALTQTAVVRRGAAWDYLWKETRFDGEYVLIIHLCHINRRIIAYVRVVGAASDREAQTGRALLQNNVLLLPAHVANVETGGSAIELQKTRDFRLVSC